MTPLKPFLGAVLTEGKSVRLGVDKTTLLKDGTPLAAYVGSVLLASGAEVVVAVGGPQTKATSHSIFFDHWADAETDQGPLAGVVAVLEQISSNAQFSKFETCLIFAADTPNLGVHTPQQLIENLEQHPDADVAVLVVDEVDQPLTAAWRSTALENIRIRYAENERSVRAVLSDLSVIRVHSTDKDAIDDVDVPSDLGRYDLRNE